MGGYVRVINQRADMMPDAQPEPDEVVLKVDRSNPVLGNRHILKNKLNHVERTRVIAAYRRDLERDIEKDGPMSREIEAIATRVVQGEKICMACWCAPMDCHGDVIAEKVNQAVARRRMTIGIQVDR